MIDTSQIKFGRVELVDPRDQNYSISNWLTEPANNFITEKMWWENGWWGNQEQTPMCVAYAWSAWLEDGPVVETTLDEGNIPKPIYVPSSLYAKCQLIDGLPDPHQGSTVRAGAKVLQALGWIKEYRWANSIDLVVKALLEVGPLVVGTTWYNNMFTPDEEYIVSVGGGPAGGHCYVLNGVDTTRGLLRIKNSWGQSWGDNGNAYIAIDDFKFLLENGGEACSGWKLQLTSVPPIENFAPNKVINNEG